MDSETAKNLISRIRQSDLDEDEQEAAIRMVKAERADAKPAATVSVAGPNTDMGGTVRLALGERTPVEIHAPEEWKADMDYDEDDYVSMTVDLELTRLNGEIPSGAGVGAPSSSAYDDALIMGDYHLTYGQAKDLLRLLEPESSPGTPGDCGSRLRHVLGPPEDVNPLLRSVQENGVRGWRRLEK